MSQKSNEEHSKFDMCAEYTGKKYSLSELCRELQNEGDDVHVIEWESILHKFTNTDKSGILDKLITQHSFDMEKIADGDDKEYFDMLKLLKVLYKIEKEGTNKSEMAIGKKMSETRVRITDILKHPSMENIYTYYSTKSVYGETFEYLEKTIASAIGDSEERTDRYQKINYKWDKLVNILFSYVFTPKALEKPEKAAKELDRIYAFLDEQVLKKIKGTNPEAISASEGVLTTFYNILQNHRCLCMDADRQNFEFSMLEKEEQNQGFIDHITQYKDWIVPWNVISQIQNAFKEKKAEGDLLEIIELITCTSPFENKDFTHYRYAINHIKDVTEWWCKYKEYDFSEGVGVITLTAFIHEIVYAKKSRLSVDNRYFGYHVRYKSLLSFIKSKDSADSKAQEAMLVRIENREALYCGVGELIKKKRDIEGLIYAIKEFIYGFRNIEEMEFVNDVLYHFVDRSLVSDDYAIMKGFELAGLVYEKLTDKAKIFVNHRMFRVLKLYRDLALEDEDTMDEVALAIATAINNDIVTQDDACRGGGIWCDITIGHKDESDRKYKLGLFADKKEQLIVWDCCMDIADEDKTKRMAVLGLQKFKA